MPNEVILEHDYNSLLNQSVTIIENARSKVALQVNAGVSSSYYEIGRLLYERKLESTHGSGVVKRLSSDLKERYPKMGFSPRQMWNMKKFYERYCNSDLKLLRSVALLPWSHNLLLLNKNLDDAATAYYAEQIIAKAWSRDLLLNAVKMEMHKFPDKIKSSNFQEILPANQAKIANETFSDTVNLGFLGVSEPLLELDLEKRIVEKVKLFLLELGKGFTYIGNQHALEFNGKEYRVDLLLYHRKLHSLVAIDLKIGDFKPEYVGKMNFYLSLLDEIERESDENPSIGIIMCAEKDSLDVQVALKDVNKPIGVTDYKLLIPQEELEQVVHDEIEQFNKDLTVNARK